ncbi:RodZ domain-containing protein, partial [Vibrio sp. 10N.222.55.F12]
LTEVSSAEDSVTLDPVEVIEEAPEAADVASVTAEPETVASEAVVNELVMQFSADCWIQVKDASGKTLSTGIKKAGQTLNLSGTAPY